MDLRHELDKAIRDKKGVKDSGYKYTYKRKDKEHEKTEPRYMTNEAWKAFLEDMERDYKHHYEAYKNGSGREFNDSGHPPKMACFGSSSLFTYKLLREYENIDFEHKLPTNVGGTANLDAYLCCGNTDIFIEAKSREIYVSANNTLKKTYIPVYQFIHEQFKAFDINYEGEEVAQKGFKYNDKPVDAVDIKQLICHFLAISANYLNSDTAKNNIRFVYLIYNPSELKGYTEHYDAICKRYEYTLEEVKSIDMGKLFEEVFKYQENRLNKHGKAMPNFEFKRADQHNIAESLK